MYIVKKHQATKHKPTETLVLFAHRQAKARVDGNNTQGSDSFKDASTHIWKSDARSNKIILSS